MRINDSNITTKENKTALIIQDVSYCGDYYEVLLSYKEYSDSSLIVRTQASNFLKVGNTMYLDIDSRKIILIAK